jgi:hypothetical protein
VHDKTGISNWQNFFDISLENESSKLLKEKYPHTNINKGI